MSKVASCDVVTDEPTHIPIETEWRVPLHMNRQINLAPGSETHILDDVMLLFSEEAQALLRLNPIASFIWTALKQGLTPDETASELAEEFSISLDRTRSDIREVIDLWTQMGFIVSHAEPERGLRLPVKKEYFEEDRRELWDLSHSVSFSSRFTFSLADCKMTIRCSRKDQAELVNPIFAHLAREFNEPDTILDVVHEKGFHTVIRDGRVVGRCSHLNQIGPLVSQEALHAAYRSRDYLIAIHAAVLKGPCGCVALAGKPSVGKTTLAAGLTQAGYCYFTDEVGIVDRATRLAIPCPASLRVKDGSWDVIASVWPNLVCVADTVAPDGLRIRYVAPAAGCFASGAHEAAPITSLVFPTYSPGTCTEIEPMSRVEALETLRETGCEMRAVLTSEDMADLIDWLKSVDCYRMQVSSLCEAVSCIGGLLG